MIHIPQTLYDAIKEKEKEIQQTLEAKAQLESRGFEVCGQLVPLQTRAQEVLGDPQYRNNPLTQRLQRGESLQEIAEGILRQRVYRLKLPWNKEEREAYNTQARTLAELCPRADRIQGHPIYSLNEPEGFTMFNALTCGLIGGLGADGLQYVSSEPLFNAPTGTVMALGALTIGTLGGMWGALLSSLPNKRAIRDNAEQIRKEATYIDNALQGKP